MQMLFKKISFAVAAALGMTFAAGAEEAIVNEGKINVRGQPSLIGEVVTQLERGDKVTVLERVQIENPKPGDPATWAKIKLPANTPVWVFSPFVKDGAVTASRLNLRAGPGDNYSVIGRIEKGAKVKSIRTIEEWMEIEAPAEAYAFIDASLIKSSGQETAATTTIPSPAGTAVATTPPPAAAASTPETTPATPTPVQPELQPAVQTPSQPAIAASTPETTPSQVSQPATTAPVLPPPTTPEPLPQVAQPAARPAETVPGKRLVRREGFIRATKSIQAPTWYELVHPETKVVINYLHEEKLGVNLKGYRGQKVIVSGEEAIDPRWPNTPILELESLDVAP